MSVVDARTRHLIETHGHAVVCVPGRPAGFFAYTLGLGLAGLAELYCTGDAARPLGRLMNDLAAAQRAAAGPWQAGQVVAVPRTGPEPHVQDFRVHPVTSERLAMVRRFYGRMIPAWRMRPEG